jgi:hypothetical protein
VSAERMLRLLAFLLVVLVLFAVLWHVWPAELR